MNMNHRIRGMECFESILSGGCRWKHIVHLIDGTQRDATEAEIERYLYPPEWDIDILMRRNDEESGAPSCVACGSFHPLLSPAPGPGSEEIELILCPGCAESLAKYRSDELEEYIGSVL